MTQHDRWREVPRKVRSRTSRFGCTNCTRFPETLHGSYFVFLESPLYFLDAAKGPRTSPSNHIFPDHTQSVRTRVPEFCSSTEITLALLRRA